MRLYYTCLLAAIIAVLCTGINLFVQATKPASLFIGTLIFLGIILKLPTMNRPSWWSR